jgi:hypothetical protein
LGTGFFSGAVEIDDTLTVNFDATIVGNMTMEGRQVASDGSTTFEIFEMADFPAPVAGVITLSSGKYIIKESISTADRFEIAAGAIVTVVVEDSHGQLLTYTGDATAFTSTDYTRISMDKFNMFCTGTNATAFNLVGSGAFTLANGRIIMTGANSSLGTIDGCSVFAFRQFTIAAFFHGFDLIDCQAVQGATLVVQPNLASSGIVFNILGRSLIGLLFQLVPAVLGPGTSLFYINPVINAIVNIQNVSLLGPGKFFATGASGAITSFSDVSRSGVSIPQVAGNPSEGPIFQSIAHALNVGEIVTQSGFAVSEYNGTFTVSEIVDADFYKVRNGVYNGNHSGVFATTTTDALTATTLSNGDVVNITDTLEFNGGYEIFNNTLNHFQFSLGKAFPVTEAGTWDLNSLDETSKWVDVLSSAAQPESKNFGFAQMNGNTTATTTADGTYGAIQVVGIQLNPSSQLWELPNLTLGVFRYIGLNPFSGLFIATINASKLGVVVNYRFAVSIDGAVPVFATAEYARMEVKTTNVQVTFQSHVTVTPGQTVQLMVAGDGTSNSLTITDIAMELAG